MASGGGDIMTDDDGRATGKASARVGVAVTLLYNSVSFPSFYPRSLPVRHVTPFSNSRFARLAPLILHSSLSL